MGDVTNVATRGRGRGRGGPNRGGGNNRAATGGASGVPLAAQMRQLQRLDEPKEMSVFRRFSKLELTTVESVYGPTGLLETKMRIPSSSFKPHWGLRPSDSGTTLISLVQGEQVLRAIEAHESIQRGMDRQEARLPVSRRKASWSQISEADKEILLLSNAEYRRRFPSGNGNGGVVLDGAASSRSGGANQPAQK